MDPNETLSDIRAVIKSYDDPTNIDDERVHYANEIVELFTSLDVWLIKGGFLPSEWMRAG
jgi:hypothetical protein